MTDVFISYSRKDIAFARLLHESLIENRLETWIDWQDIPPSADWLAEVYEAIERADSFVFVISETSLNSEICGLEIDHAAKHNKRLIPIVIKDIETEQVPKELAVLNWIFFEEAGEKFAEAMEDLVTAITADQPWIKAHTRLENRALEWEKKKDRGLLLRGGDLTEAESWLAGSAGKDPQPTALQTQFILKSREDATRRQRLTLIGVGAGLVVAVGLGILAWTQRNVAVEQKNIAVSRQLSAQGLFEASDQFDLALLLGLGAVQRTEGDLWARGNLLEIMQTSPRLISFIQNDDEILLLRPIAFSPNGQILAIASEDNNIILWDVSNPKSPVQIGHPITGYPDIASSLVFSPDGQILALGSYEGVITLWNVNTSDALTPLGQPITGHTNSVRDLAFSPDGQMLASGSRDNSIILWDVSNPESPVQIGQPLTGHSFDVARLAFSPDGLILAAGCDRQPIILWNVSNPASPIQIGEPLANLVSGMQSLIFSPDGQSLASGHRDQKFALMDFTQIDLLESSKYLHFLPERVDDLAFSPDLQVIASTKLSLSSNILGKSIILWDISSPSVPKQLGQPLIGHTSYLSGYIFSPDGQILASVSWDGTIILWDLSDAYMYKRIGRSLDGKTKNGMRSVAYSPDGKILAGVNGDDIILLWNAGDLDSPVQIDQPNDSPFLGGDALAFSPNGQILAVSLDDSIILWDFGDPDSPKQFNHQLTAHSGDVQEIAFSPNGQILASGSRDDSIILWDVSIPESPVQIGQPLTNHASVVYGLAFSPDGKILASGSGGDNKIILWDVTNPDSSVLLGQPVTSGGTVNCLAFSPDGKMLASGTDVIKLWDVSNQGALVQIGQEFTGHSIEADVNDLAFSTDGQILASGHEDGAIFLWDVSNPNAPEQLSQQLAGHTGEVFSLAFSPDGQFLASGSEDNTIILWNISQEAWSEEACRLAGRNLTQDEWEKYMPLGEVYQKTCPDLP